MLYNIETQLVHQKNAILALVNDERYEEASTLLAFAHELWAHVGYEYKFFEIRRRIQEELRTKEVQADHHATAAKYLRLYQSVTERLNVPQAA